MNPGLAGCYHKAACKVKFTAGPFMCLSNDFNQGKKNINHLLNIR